MGKANPDYRPNPARSIRVFSELTEEIISNILAQIIDLRSQSSEPITVYINSRGGIARGLDLISGALKTYDGGGHACRVITVAVGDAASAAANLLALGDYAIAYPYSTIHFHGTRLSEVEVTKEDAQSLAAYLASRNRSVAFRAALMMLPRMVHRYARVKKDFAKFREECGEANASEIECFVGCISTLVTDPAIRVLNHTLHRLASAAKMSKDALANVDFAANKAGVAQDADVLKAVLEYDLKENEADLQRRLQEPEVENIVQSYFLLRDFEIGEHLDMLDTIIDVFGFDFLSDDEQTTYEQVPEEEKEGFLRELVRPRVQHFWNFAVLLCRRLQEGENRLAAEDAYWMGVVDEIQGVEMLHGERLIHESEIDPAPDAPASSEDTASTVPGGASDE